MSALADRVRRSAARTGTTSLEREIERLVEIEERRWAEDRA